MNSIPTTIILADDDPEDSLFLLEVLLRLPIELTVIAVPNGEQLISILDSVSPQVIFLDINMPKKDGFDALRHIRMKRSLDETMVIMCSGSNSTDEIKLSMDLGADMHLLKGDDMNNLDGMVKTLFASNWREKIGKRIPGVFSLGSGVQFDQRESKSMSRTA